MKPEEFKKIVTDIIDEHGKILEAHGEQPDMPKSDWIACLRESLLVCGFDK